MSDGIFPSDSCEAACVREEGAKRIPNVRFTRLGGVMEWLKREDTAVRRYT
ncbi:MAG: hypothetical protein Q4E24_10045 [bacterium]|nr:hypothetical protein [bacterium]